MTPSPGPADTDPTAVTPGPGPADTDTDPTAVTPSPGPADTDPTKGNGKYFPSLYDPPEVQQLQTEYYTSKAEGKNQGAHQNFLRTV